VRWKRASKQPNNIMPLTLRSRSGELWYLLPGSMVRNLRYMLTRLTATQELPQRVALTSALSGEGVTTLALALAATLANDTGARVALVELNWWSPGLLRILSQAKQIEDSPKRKGALPKEPALLESFRQQYGLADYLEGRASLDEVLLESDMPNLCLVPAGELTVRQQPIMARSQALQAAINELGERFDYLILDLPAVLSSSDAIVLGSLANACCFVVQQGVTSRAQVQNALDDIKHLPVLGVLLNQSQIKTPQWLQALMPQE
jgi:ATPases involved in chromosome partitioning